MTPEKRYWKPDPNAFELLSGESKQDYFLNKALAIADFLHGKGNVKFVGIAGSLSRRNKIPHDIDLVVGVPNELITPVLKRMHLETQDHQGLSVSLIRSLGLTDDELGDLDWIPNGLIKDPGGSGTDFIRVRVPVQYLIVSDHPDEEFLELMRQVNQKDPDLYPHLMTDLKVYDPAKNEFIRAQNP